MLEEAAKILILMDVVRCPPKLIASRLNKLLISWFYDHLARLIYAEATTWKPMHLAQLRDYVDQQRRGHYIEGHAGEYIMPNWTVYERKRALRRRGSLSRRFAWLKRPAWLLSQRYHTQCIHAAGTTCGRGYTATRLVYPEGAASDVGYMGQPGLRDKEDHQDGERLTEQLLTRVHAEGLILDTAENAHVTALYHEWQIPMYDKNGLIPVTLAELRAKQGAISGPWLVIPGSDRMDRLTLKFVCESAERNSGRATPHRQRRTSTR